MEVNGQTQLIMQELRAKRLKVSMYKRETNSEKNNKMD